ncbi:MAG: DUF1566 domain-containing protein [Gammaproteobacteria bacterium]|nr:DUF1566 domain-containing protein [Gammaproteobacteria bacterium]
MVSLKYSIKVLFPVLLLAGVVGCSCSKRPDPSELFEPGIYLLDTATAEGQSGKTSVLNFKILLVPARDAEVTVSYTHDTVNPELISVVYPDETIDIAAASSDYIQVSEVHEVVFAPGETEKTVSVTVTGDDLYEHNEAVAMKLLGSSNEYKRKNAYGLILNDDPPPIASVNVKTAAGEVVESLNEGGDLGQDNKQVPLKVEITLDKVSGLDAKVAPQYEENPYLNNEATYRSDFALYSQFDASNIYLNRLKSDDVITIPAGETKVVYDLVVIDDGSFDGEGSESLILKLNPRTDVSVNSTGSKAVIEIFDNEIDPASIYNVLLDGQLNKGIVDTGVNTKVGTINGQDADVFGAAFNFQYLDAQGVATNDQDLAKCVKDMNTGLVWEIKRAFVNIEEGADPVAHALANRHWFGQRFTWYEPEFHLNGGRSGTPGQETCFLKEDSGSSETKSCSTSYYAADVNLEQFCGLTGWRLPSIEEMRSVSNYAIDDVHSFAFAAMQNNNVNEYPGEDGFWSNESAANDTSSAWVVFFKDSSATPTTARSLYESIRGKFGTETSFFTVRANGILVNDGGNP